LTRFYDNGNQRKPKSKKRYFERILRIDDPEKGIDWLNGAALSYISQIEV